VLALIEGFMPEAGWLDDSETLTYLHSCVSTRRQRVHVPETPIYLDAILVDEDLTGGLEPRLGRAHLRTLTVMGFHRRPGRGCSMTSTGSLFPIAGRRAPSA
jgi:type IV secretion system protein TrbE